MKQHIKEIRDPIHNFIHVDGDEMMLINSRPFQRLRHIHQLAMSYLVYPGATHKRFEHSLGVMELAGKAFDAISQDDHLDESARSAFPNITNPQWKMYWRKVLRLAALCHDMGHPPFSHAAEKELFPTGISHESLTRRIIESDEMLDLFKRMVPRVQPVDVVKLALGRKEAKDLVFSEEENLLAEIITGDSLGVDRMDYLLRDAYHAGVAYGKFDHFRLLETLRIVPPPSEPEILSKVQHELKLNLPEPPCEPSEPSLGLLIGGIHSSEALLLARYFMYAQVYFHRVRIAYNHHLKCFLKDWLPGGLLPTGVEDHLRLTDNEVHTAMRESAGNKDAPGHIHAKRILSREHFKRLVDFSPATIRSESDRIEDIYESLKQEFGEDNLWLHKFIDPKDPQQFPVRLKNGRSESSVVHSPVLRSYPKLAFAFILINPDHRERASRFLKERHDITP